MGGVEPEVERLPDSSYANGIPNQTVLPTIRLTLVHGNGQTPPVAH